MVTLLTGGACQRPKPPEGLLRVALESFPTNLDPRLATDAYSYDLIETLYNGLLRPSSTGDYEGDLAEGVERIGDLRYRVKLRPSVHFHHGIELRASDVLCTYRSVLDPMTGSPVRGSFEPLQGIEIKGPLELDLVLARPYAPFLEALTLPILPCDLIRAGHSFRDQPVGTGFLRFVEMRPPSWVDLIPFEGFFRQPPQVKRVRFEATPNPTTRVLSLLRGEADLAVNNVPALYVDYLREKGKARIQTTPGTNFTYIGFNLRDPLLSQLPVRRAIAHAIDREELVRYRMRGLADLAHGILPADHWAAIQDVRRYAYDPALAERLLDAAGYPRAAAGGVRLSLLYKTSQNKDRLRMIEVIRQQLFQVGIDVHVQPYEWGTFFDQIKRGEFQLYSLSWIGVTDPDFYYTVFHSEQTPERGGRNRGHYVNPRVDRLFEDGRHELDRKLRAGYYAELQRVLADDLPYLPLWHERNVAILSPRVEGYQLDRLASFRALEQVRLKEVP